MKVNHVLRALLLVFVVSAVGCESKNKGLLEGTSWSSKAMTVRGKALPDGIITLTFGSTGGLQFSVGPERLTGKYQLGWGEKVTFEMDKPLEGRKTHVETIKIEGNQLTMIDSDGTTVCFVKTSGPSVAKVNP